MTGCNHLNPRQGSESVYVLAKESFLRDRVAAVSNRVGVVQNGQHLVVLERGRRFLKVKTDKGEIGWIEEHAVVNPEVATGFLQLQKAHERDPVVATAVLRDDGYLHLKPGRDTDRFYLLPEGDKLQLLVRASVPKAIGPQASGTASSYASKPTVTPAKKAAKARDVKDAKEKAEAKRQAENRPPTPAPPPGPPAEMLESTEPAAPPPAPVPVAMEDWWMVRDAQGKVGWVISRRIDVDVPDEIAAYADGQRMVGAYLLRKVDDPESNFPDKQAPEYITVLNPYQDALPYDFSQVRVFTWNLKKHRYETAFRQRNLQGYLPVVVATQTLDKGGSAPTFQFKQGIGDSVTIDPETGAIKPTSTQTLTYQLDGAQVRKVDPGAPGGGKTPVAASAQQAAKSTQAVPPNEKHGSARERRGTPRRKHRHRG